MIQAHEEQKPTLPLKAAYPFGAEHGLEHEVNEIREMKIMRDGFRSSLRRGCIVALFEKHGLFETFKKECWSFGNTPEGETIRRHYLRIKARYEALLEGRGPSTSAGALEFALEAHLRDFLAKNLDRIEPGLQIYCSPSGKEGVEFGIDGGHRIDLLAVDRDQKFVVIELKLSEGRNKALGQLLYYMGWVDPELGHGPCRGFIIASEITEELSIAVSRVPGIRLANYRMSFAIEPVGTSR